MIIMLTRTAQHTPTNRTARRARARRGAKRQLRATDAVVHRGRIERQLVHPIGGLEGYSPTEVRAEQVRARDPHRPEALTGDLSVER
jgi:hypothetical protein